MRARTWEQLLATAWPVIAARWSTLVVRSARRALVRLSAIEGDGTVHERTRLVDPGAPGRGAEVLRAALASMLRELPSSFVGRLQVRFEQTGGGAAEDWEAAVEVAQAPPPATVLVEREKTHRALLRADEAKTLAMVEMHRQAPAVIQASAQAIAAAAGVRAVPPVATSPPSGSGLEGLVGDVLEFVRERLEGGEDAGGAEIPANDAGAEREDEHGP